MSRDEAFAEYVTARWTALYRFACLLVGESDAEDLTQAALLKVYAKWNKVETADSPDAYVKRVIVNTSISEGRRRHRAYTSAPGFRSNQFHDAPERHIAEQSEMWARLLRLPPRQRAVMVLRYYEDMSEADIALTLNCAPGTVKAHASAALRTLRANGIASTAPENGGGRHD